MNGVEISRTSTTQLKAKKATIDSDGNIYVEGGVIDFVGMLTNIFQDCIFDITVTEKNKLNFEEEN